MKKGIIILTMILFCTCTEGNAQTLVLNSVDDAIEFAFENNPDLVTYRQNHRIAKADYSSVKYHWLPNISASFSGVDNLDLPVTRIPGEIFGQPGKTIEAEFGEKYNYNAGLTFSVNLLDFQAKFSAKVAKINMEMAEINESVFKQKLAEQVALYYYTALVTARAIEAHEQNYETAHNILTIVEQRFDQGIVDQYQLNLARMNQNTIIQNINSYKVILEQCHSQLKILFGSCAETSLDYSGLAGRDDMKIPVMDFIGPDKGLELFELQVRQSDYLIKQQKAKWIPKFSVTGYWGAQQYRDNLGLSFSNNEWSDLSYISVNLSFPIFTGFSNRNQLNSAVIQNEMHRNTLEYEVIKSNIIDEKVVKEYRHSREAADSANDNYNLADSNADLQFQKYEQGVIGLDTYLDAFDYYLKAEVTYLNLLAESYTYYSKIMSRNF
jgi:outer membrane protein TolC